MKNALNIIKYLLFLGIGVYIFSFVYKEYDLSEFILTLKELKWGWVILSLVLAILSHISRAIRWNMLIRPTVGFQPKFANTFFSVIILYATNLIIPRGGELVRCTVLSRYEKIPFGKLVGTVVTERATDTFILMLLFFATVFFQIGLFKQFLFNNPEFNEVFSFLFSFWFWIILIIAGFGGFYALWKLRSKLKLIKPIGKLFELFYNFFDGIKSIAKLERPWAYISHSIFIYVMYFLMMYVVFFAYEPTKNMGVLAGLTAFIMGSLAMLAPVQGGIGAFHFMVIEALALYGIDRLNGKEYALITHTSINLMLLLSGALCFILLPFINKKPIESN